MATKDTKWRSRLRKKSVVLWQNFIHVIDTQLSITCSKE